MEFDGRIAVVTGGSKGIGKATSLAFCQRGALVIANYASDQRGAQELCKKAESLTGTLIPYQADVTDFE